MNTFHYIIGYQFDNHSLASDIDQKLNRVGFHFDHIHTGNALLDQSIGERIIVQSKTFLLLITDNFLKDENCIYKLFETLLTAEKQGRKFHVVLANGHLIDPISGNMREIETKLSSVGDILYYINYWQDKYLQMRKKYLEEDKSLQVADNKLKQVREIASEIGELLHKIRNLNPVTFENFAKDQFKYFFDISGHSESYEAYKKMSAYDEQDAKIERQVQNILQQTEGKPEETSIGKNLPEEILLEQIAESEKAVNTNQQILSSEGASSHSELNLLEQLKSFKDEILSTEDQNSQQTGKPSVKETEQVLPDTIITSTDKMDKIRNLDKEMSENLGKLLFDKFGDVEYDDKSSDDQVSEKKPTNILDSYRDQLIQDPDNIELRLELIKLLMQDNENFSESADHLEHILVLDKNNIEAIYLIGKLSESVGEYALAKTYYKKLSVLQPDFPGIFEKLAEIIENHFPDEKPELAYYYKKAFDHDTTNLEALEKRAVLLYKSLGKPKKAKKILQKLIKWDPFHPTAYYYLAEIHFQAGEKEKATEAFKKAKEITGRLTSEEKFEPNANDESSSVISKSKQLIETPERTLAFDGPKKVETYVCITGATSGIGKATARLLASKGRNLIITGRRKDRLEDLAEELEEQYDVIVEPLVFDIRNQIDIEKTILAHKDKIENIEVLINNAGLALGLDYIHEGNIDQWNTMIDTNIKGLLYMTRMISPYMVEKRKGHIINICSTAGKEVYPKGNVYCATKFAVDALTKAFRQDLHNFNIRVSQVAPGHTENTEFALVRFEGDDNKSKIYNDFNPLKSEDIANIIDFIINQPPHVNIQDVLITSTQQASSTLIDRTGRKFDK